MRRFFFNEQIMATSYCDFVNNAGKDTVHRHYHDNEYGFPLHTDNELFARLILEINQAGLSWETILKKKDNFFKAFDNFNIEKVSRYTDAKKEKLMQDAGIIRNRLKIEATIDNAKKIKAIQKEFGSFKNWLDANHPKTRDEWVKLFKTNFRFTGGEIVNEFLMSTGYLPGAHISTCPVYKKIMKQKPAWQRGNVKCRM
jgi:DNA-3-methyladenine glycosylase I